MDFRYLECFIAVVSSGSIAEAARNLDMAPTTLTQRLKALEASLGCQLLRRSGRTVKPTVAGTRILGYAHTAVAIVKNMQSAASNTNLPQGPLRLGATPTVVTEILPDVLADWVKGFPKIDIFIEPAVTRVLYSQLLAGDLDVVVLAHPNFSLAKTCIWRKLREEELILLAPPAVDVNDALVTLAEEPFIRYDRRTVAGKMVDDYLLARHIQPRARFELDGISPIIELVSRGLGVAILPNSPVIGRIAPALQKWVLPEPCPRRTIGALWLRSSPRSPLAEAFVEMAVDRLLSAH
ncbi:MAG TPA: LysR family transcriptional regulator [Eoetvoesiella sp.]